MMTALMRTSIVLVICLVGVGHGAPEAYFSIPLVDLDGRGEMQVVVDREAGHYLGHPTTVLLEDGKTIYCVYPKGHGRGAIVMKRSDDGVRSGGIRSRGRRAPPL